MGEGSGAMAELFDIYDEDGSRLGTAERKEVHERGYWHHTFHCWIARRTADGGTNVLFQRRASGKDTNPGCFDITAAGHLEAGETPADAVRELKEELGLDVPFGELIPFGTVRETACGEIDGLPYRDNEISHVFGLFTDKALDEFRLQEEEVAGLFEADAHELVALMEGRIERLAVRGVTFAGSASPTVLRAPADTAETATILRAAADTAEATTVLRAAADTAEAATLRADAEDDSRLRWTKTEATREQFVPRDYDYYISIIRFLQSRAP